MNALSHPNKMIVMRKPLASSLIFAALLAAMTATPLFASGGYKGIPPKPPAKAGEKMTMKMDREKYGLGQKVYDGEAMTPGGDSAAAQMARLKSAQMKLPPDAMKMKDLTGLAGKLSPAQLDALEYFVDQRFSMKK